MHLAPSAPGDHRKVYEGRLDPTWNILSVPCGGYALALVLQACIQHQASTSSHIDPLHTSAHFLRPTNSKIPFKIYVHTLKAGKGFSNLVAELYQEDVLRITSHAIFGVNALSPDDPLGLTLEPPSPYARRHPLNFHPSDTRVTPTHSMWNFHNNISWAYDDQIISRNSPSHPSRSQPLSSSPDENIGGAGLEWGGYLQFNIPTERLSYAYLPFLVDMFQNTLNLLPKAEAKSARGSSWFPTMTLAMEFKFPISLLNPEKHSLRNVALYSNGRFVNHPQGRHDVYVEVWTAPAELGQGTVRKGWREEQFCLATATQMALTVPVAINLKNGKDKDAKL